MIKFYKYAWGLWGVGANIFFMLVCGSALYVSVREYWYSGEIIGVALLLAWLVIVHVAVLIDYLKRGKNI
jgi:hypothetical protein